MAISAAQVRELRDATGAGMMDCKKALEESGGDLDAAKDFLRKKGIAIAQKKAERETHEGAIGLALEDGRKRGALVHLGCETDFVARNDQFQALLARLAGQILAAGDQNVLEQNVTDGSGTVGEVLTEAIATLGENLQVLDASRVEVSGEGVVSGYVHSNQKIGVLVSVAADGAADREALETLARDLAMHVAASPVSAVSRDDLDPALLAKEKEILKAQAAESGKPDEIIEKMVQGRLNKYVQEVTLLEQPFVKDPDKTVKQLLEETGKTLGTGLRVERFVKLQV